MSRIQAWKEVVEKVKARLSRWKMKTLSIGGRLTLLKLVLGCLPIFHMSIFKVPSKVLHELESLRGHLFNGHEAGSNKASWVKWDSVLVDKDRGISSVESAIHGDDGNVSMNNKFVVNSCWSYIIKEVRLLADR
uniref:RNA-directed DNA polymerase, eukaryota n=1 Tax=Tanacetum cinerariifolium TaxID=118510 RepID=A0A699I9Q4_TANCI|nr:RNA-directed DNA polymerase, eukaryota [Tanacetum cinerariifolium]